MNAEQLIDAYLNEKSSWKQGRLVKELSKRKDVRNPEALAAWIGRRKGRKAKA